MPHTLKTYREEVWRRFWIFDVYHEAFGYLPFALYAPHFKSAGIELDVIEPLCTIDNPTEAQIRAQVETNTFLVRDGCGVGEGIVIKNYGWKNKFGRQPWAKIVRNEFKEQNRIAFGTTEKAGEFQVEVAIAQRYCTPEFVGKTRAKVVLAVANEVGIDITDPNAQQRIESTYRGKVIPRMLGTCWHELVMEEMWTVVKEHREPIINFKLLRQHVQFKVKEYAKDLFS